MLSASVVEKPIQARTRGHREPKVPQERNKCWADSAQPQPVTHWARSGKRMPRATRFVFVGNRSCRRRQAKIDTFMGTCLCKEIFIRLYSNCILRSQYLISITDKITGARSGPPLPPVWKLNL
ncbi:hypothetical protein QL285_038335 [Trifolium repens]|nr:hypothetical protein QL285_038335 [Trifolium repens]